MDQILAPWVVAAVVVIVWANCLWALSFQPREKQGQKDQVTGRPGSLLAKFVQDFIKSTILVPSCWDLSRRPHTPPSTLCPSCSWVRQGAGTVHCQLTCTVRMHALCRLPLLSTRTHVPVLGSRTRFAVANLPEACVGHRQPLQTLF